MSCHRKRGGGATVFPLDYYDPSYSLGKNVSAGRDLLHASGRGIRPSLGGKRRTKRTHRLRRKQGGFVPSVMEGFVEAASKYIVPIALYAGYKLMSRKKNRKRRRTHRK
jgi:hypothetical protein